MFDLEAAVTDSIQKMVQADQVRPIIEKQIAATVATIIRETLGDYSDFGKQIREQVKASLNVGELGLAGYNETVCKIVRAQLDAAIETQGAAMLKKNIEEMLGGATKREVKVSELVIAFAKWARNEKQESRIHAELDDPSYGSRTLYLSVNSDKYQSKYSAECQVSFRVDPKDTEPNRVWAIKWQGKDPSKQVFVGPLCGFEKTLFQLYATGSTLVVDTEDLDSIESQQDDEDQD